MKLFFLAAILACVSTGTFAKSADVVIGDCTDSMMAIVVDAARGAGETVPPVDSKPMQDTRNGFGQVCVQVYEQGLASRDIKGIKMDAHEVQASIKAATLANDRDKKIPDAVADRMADTATVAFMAGYNQ